MTALALWWPSRSPVVVQAMPRGLSRPDVGASPSLAAEAALRSLPLELEPWALEPARRDPFVPVELPQPRPVAVAPPAPAAFSPPPAPNPPPPSAVTLRYLGSMVTPEGAQVVMLARGEVAVAVQVGTMLEEGYVVQAMSRDAVRLLHPPTGMALNVPIPEPAPDRR